MCHFLEALHCSILLSSSTTLPELLSWEYYTLCLYLISYFQGAVYYSTLLNQLLSLEHYTLCLYHSLFPWSFALQYTTELQKHCTAVHY
jgi:hypothetical protein